jgi:signal-transduction protein with cAMP-binding, CBS, and nucleotidyltransferase domain
MMLAELATRPAVTIPHTTTLAEAARQMLEREIGFLVVVDGKGRPTGVVTDRDIVVRAVALGRGGDTAVAEIMSRHPASVDVNDTVADAARRMADRQCRRVVMIDRAGGPVGVLSLDDLLQETGRDLAEVARAVRGPRHSHRV